MVVRIRARRPAVLRGAKNFPAKFALAAASLLGPASVMACALGVWRLGADLQWMGEFAISSGLFSHWQVWILLAAVLQLAAQALQRFARNQPAQ